MKDYVTKNTQYNIDLAILNPGSLRTDAIPDENGKFTYGNAVGIQPYANEMYNVQMTGANLKEILEQQWQVDSQGQRPTRKYLALSLSDGFSYTVNTLDPDAAPGGHVLTMRLGNKPIEDNKIYNILTSSFLSEGGDNFRAFTNGKATDVGLVDTNVFTKYLSQIGVDHNVYPTFDRSGIVASGKLNDNYKTGDQIDQTISHLNMFSVGAQQNKTVDIYVDSKKIGSAPVVNPAPSALSPSYSYLSDYDTDAGYSQINATIPNDVKTGEHEIKYIVQPSNTSVSQFVHIENTNPNPGPNPGPKPNPEPYPNTGLNLVQIYLFAMLLLTAGGSSFMAIRKKL
jgi:5'-nucleotidase